MAWPNTGRTFRKLQKVLPWPGPRWTELSAIRQKFCSCWAQDGQNFWRCAKSSALASPKIDRTSCYTQQFLSLLGLRWAKLLTIYQKFRPGLAQEGQNFLQYTKSSALAWPKIDRTSCTRPKVLPWPGPTRAEFFSLY